MPNRAAAAKQHTPCGAGHAADSPSTPLSPVDGQPEVIYPVPWAQSAATRTLITADATRTCIEQAGFAVTLMEDVTQKAMEWAQQQATSIQADTGNEAIHADRRQSTGLTPFRRVDFVADTVPALPSEICTWRGC